MLDSIPLALVVLLNFGTAAPPGAPDVASQPLGPPAERYIPADPWFAEDKAKHFFMAFAATGFAYGAARSVGLGSDAALVTAGTGTMAAGVGKELHDRRAGGRFSTRDLVWNVVGIAAGLVVAANTR